MARQIDLRRKWGSLALMLLFIAPPLTAVALSSAVPPGPFHDAALRLVKFCNDPKTGFDERDIATLVDFVTNEANDGAYVLPESKGCPGAYQGFDTKIPLSRFMEYSFNALIPSVVTRPSSLRYSFWRERQDKMHRLPNSWRSLLRGGNPVILHGLQHDSNTPDLTTGIYYEYDLKRTIVLTHHRGRSVLVSISKQIDKSKVGKKGFILGNDSDWNYYYSGEPGSAKTGLGWIDTYIYDYFSVTVYVESDKTPVMLKTGVFQWIRAGWSGINFVRPSHIIRGMERFARNSKIVLESPHLPAPNQVIIAYKGLSNTPFKELAIKYEALQQARRSLALQSGNILKSKANHPLSLDKTSKEQMVEELMLEFLKGALGKPMLLGSQHANRHANL